MELKNSWLSYTAAQKKELEKVCSGYRHFLDEGKTERECVDFAVAAAEKAGYKNLADIIKKGTKLKSGDKVYSSYMGKTIALFNIGSEPIESGLNILGAH
ncbi:MAG: aminopeptidase, partial [Lachnospiraceae bacterium]|nr:aminopeptidase [Lachnospiraceae bacterium]